jgi:putative NADPH-quinone reductase
MGRRIVIVQGHPDPGGGRYGHALAQAYLEGAREAGHEVESLERNILAFTGFGPIHRTLIGMVEAREDKGRTRRLAQVRKLGRQGQ